MFSLLLGKIYTDRERGEKGGAWGAGGEQAPGQQMGMRGRRDGDEGVPNRTDFFVVWLQCAERRWAPPPRAATRRPLGVALPCGPPALSCAFSPPPPTLLGPPRRRRHGARVVRARGREGGRREQRGQEWEREPPGCWRGGGGTRGNAGESLFSRVMGCVWTRRGGARRERQQPAPQSVPQQRGGTNKRRSWSLSCSLFLGVGQRVGRKTERKAWRARAKGKAT